MTNEFINFAVMEGRVPFDTVTLILMLPIVVTAIAFFRQVIGIKAFGIYTPALVTFAFYAIGLEAGSFGKGIKYGISIFILVILVGTLTRIILKRFRLLYLPRVAIVITVVSLSTLFVLIAGGMFQRTGLASVSIFPILIMIALVEKFVATQIEKGARTAIILSAETLIISIICFLLISSNQLRAFVQTYPWVIILTILINIVLGKWTGLRLSEYIRFKEVLKNVNPPQKK